MHCSCTDDKLSNFHENGIKGYRYFVRGISEKGRKMNPYYCNEYILGEMPVGVEIVDLKNTNPDEPYIVRKSEVGLFEFYRNPRIEYLSGNIIHEHVTERVFKDGELHSITFSDTNKRGVLIYNAENNEILMIFKGIAFVSYDDKSYFGWPDRLQELKRCKRTGKHEIDTNFMSIMLNSLRKKRNVGRFDLLDDLLNERFSFDSREIKYKE